MATSSTRPRSRRARRAALGASIYARVQGLRAGPDPLSWRASTPRDGIRVNAVAPGLIMLTPLQDRNTTPEQLERDDARDPAWAAPASPRTCVGAYLFLASDALSGFITGATIDVNGGAYLS